MNIKDIYINYEDYGKGIPVVLLHGWGQNISMMEPIGKKLKNCRVINIDLPGFGNSSEPPYGYTIYDYYEIVKELLIKLKVKNPVMIGHSFGGRIAILYAAKEEVSKLVLLSSPYKRSKKDDTVKVKILKAMKKVPIIKELESFMKDRIGSTDYRKASPIMKKVLVNTVNEDLTEYLKSIKVPTILIYGEMDTAVKIEDAKEAEEFMNDAALIVYTNCTHYAYLEQINRTNSIINNFIGGN